MRAHAAVWRPARSRHQQRRARAQVPFLASRLVLSGMYFLAAHASKRARRVARIFAFCYAGSAALLLLALLVGARAGNASARVRALGAHRAGPTPCLCAGGGDPSAEVERGASASWPSLLVMTFVCLFEVRAPVACAGHGPMARRVDGMVRMGARVRADGRAHADLSHQAPPAAPRRAHVGAARYARMRRRVPACVRIFVYPSLPPRAARQGCS